MEILITDGRGGHVISYHAVDSTAALQQAAHDRRFKRGQTLRVWGVIVYGSPFGPWAVLPSDLDWTIPGLHV